MSYCSGSKKAILRATFPNGEVAITSYNPPVDYTCSELPIPGTYDITITGERAWRTRYGNECGQLQTPPSMRLNNINRVIDVKVVSSRWGVEYENSNGDILFRNVWGNNYTIYYYPTCRQASPNSFTYLRNVTNTDIVLVSALNGGNGSNFLFKVTDSTGIIYSRTESQCPTNIRAECAEDCPENTHCECIHNGYKCCFDEQGNRIKVIPV